MQKKAAILMLCVHLICVQPRQAQAYFPAVIAAGMLGAALLVTAAGTLYKPAYVPSGWTGQGQLSTAMNMLRVVVGAQVGFSAYGQEVLKGNLVAAKANVASMQNKLLEGGQALQTKFSQMSAFLLKDSTPQGAPPSPQTKIGDIALDASGNSVQVNGVSWSSGRWFHAYYGTKYSNPSGPPATLWSDNYDNGWHTYANPTLYNDYWGYSSQCWISGVAPTPSMIARTNEDVRSRTSGDVLPIGVVDDLDKMIAENANGYGVSIVDTIKPGTGDTAPPFVWPAPEVAPTTVPAPDVTGLSQPNVAATAAQVTAAVQAVSAAEAAMNNYQTSHPGSTVENDTALADLAKEVDAAKAALTSAQTAAQSAVAANNEVYAGSVPEARKTLNFEKFKLLKGVLVNTFPFNLIPAIASSFEELVGDPQAPVFTLPVPYAGNITADLSFFDPVAKMCRFAISIVMSGGMLFYIVRFWRGGGE
ncbi:MAG: hypothetical protein FPO08_01085 [Geobacter sp.]|nr:MAG: hypothetical protein FPO08_01085 [Geobacter sp.]